MIDFNCYVGNWPFHKLRRKSFEDLKEVHRKNNIKLGYVSSIESIFYNDFYESEKDLHNMIKDSGYKQVVTVNPTMPACTLALKKCIEEFDVCGIRIIPSYHGYNINSEILNPVMDIAREKKLPVFVAARMMDERLTHMVHPVIQKKEDIQEFLTAYSDVVIVLCHFKLAELKDIEEFMINPNVFCDVSGIRDNLIEDDVAKKVINKCVYGSAFPLCPVISSIMLLENEASGEIEYILKNQNRIE